MENDQRVGGKVGKLPDKDLLQVTEVSDYLGVGEMTIYRWCRQGSLPCLKLGKSWRIRQEALLEFLGELERPATLTGRLSSFLEVPDNVVAVSQNLGFMHYLDAAFFRTGEARGGLLLKYYAGGDTDVEGLREELESRGLDVGRLEGERRLHFLSDTDNPEDRLRELDRVRSEIAQDGRSVWVAFNWEEHINLDSALEQQREITELIQSTQLVVKTSVLEELADEWPTASWLRTQAVHSGSLWLSEAGLLMSRVAPVRVED